MSDHGHEHSHSAHDHGQGGHDAHGHDAHGHDSHGHGHDAHDEHGHGNGHEQNWGDYNSQPLPPSNLPPVSPLLLVAFGTALTFLLCMIIASSLMLAQSPEHHGEKATEATAEGHE